MRLNCSFSFKLSVGPIIRMKDKSDLAKLVLWNSLQYN